MTDTKPTLTPAERDRLKRESRLVATVEPAGRERISGFPGPLDVPADADAAPTLPFESYDSLLGTFTPVVLELLETIRRENPESISEAARLVDRDVKNVHDELTALEDMGVLHFESAGRRRPPVVPFDELVVECDFGAESGDGGFRDLFALLDDLRETVANR